MLNLYYEPSYFQMSIIIINLPLNTTGYELNFSQLPVLLFGLADIQMAFLSVRIPQPFEEVHCLKPLD
jgi:hypothetical protein